LKCFFVANSTNNGSGLGLYIAREAIENLNGSINVTSELAIEQLLQSLYLTNMKLNLRILIIDDNLIDQIVTKQLLKNSCIYIH
jgi:signal transduction histidine kinase